ncbi:hypothetical protein KC957_00635 [Candidatus Saccharibacteria bacterium]|nr:hypothetical protein [Candidatus Saccharibacteria bacterium]
MNTLKGYEQARSCNQLQNGQGLVEYGLIIALVAVTVVLVLANVGTSVADAFSTVSCTLTDPATGECIDGQPTEDPDPDPCPNLQVQASLSYCRASDDRFFVRVDIAECPSALVYLSSPIDISMPQNTSKPERYRRGLNGTHAKNTICEGDYSVPLGDANITIYHDGTQSSTHTTSVTTPITIK